ncbi:MAG TPA: TetR family transcriptional regulator, partial [Polyangiaceae bacterium]|nr:TetR family transcriptional regulator [Polyangiaceae bacterium]
MAATRQKILDTARALFNERGLYRVGVRDVARAAGISPGNLGYHFPTRDDLVSALVLELRGLAARTVFAVLPDDFSLATLYLTACGAMRHMLAYRFVLLSYVDAVAASPELLRLEASLRADRRRRSDAMVARLVANGYVDGERAARAEHLFEQSEMVSSGWLGAASLRPDLRDDDAAAVLHYAKVGCALLEPYCTPKGARQMAEV